MTDEQFPTEVENSNFDFSSLPPEDNRPLVPARAAADKSFYAATLSGADPIAAYKKSLTEYQQQGQSQLVDNTTKILQDDEDLGRVKAVQATLEDPTLPKEQKREILNQYMTTRSIPVNLREKYSENLAASSPSTRHLSNQEFALSFFGKEIAADNIQKDIDKELIKYDDSFASMYWGGVAELIPFIGSFGRNYNLSELNKAVQQGDTPALKHFFFGGEAIVEIREKLKALPPVQQREAVGRFLGKLKENTGTDINRIHDLESAILSPDYTTFERAIDNSLGLLDAALAVSVKGLYSGMKRVTGLEISPKSPLGTTALYNAQNATKLSAGALLDTSGEVSHALGESKAKILAELFFQQADESLLKDVPSGIRQEIANLTGVGIEGYARSETTPFLYGKEVRDQVKSDIYDTLHSYKGLVYHQSKSSINETDELLRGVATYGKGEDEAYQTLGEAASAAEALLEKGRSGSVRIVRTNPETLKMEPVTPSIGEDVAGDYYVQLQYEHLYNPLDALAFGPVNATLQLPGMGILNKLTGGRTPTQLDISALARVPGVNRYILPATHYLDEWITRGALQAGDAYLALEQPVLKALQKSRGKLSRINGEQKMLAHLLETGSDEQKVFSYGEISSQMHAQGFSQRQVDKVAETYFLDRRADDLSYLHTNRQKVKQLVSQGMQEYHLNPSKVMHAKAVPQPPGVTEVWDDALDMMRPISEKELSALYSSGGTLGKMVDRVSQGSKYTDLVMIPAGTKTGKISDFVLNKIEGHSPRYWEEYYYVDRTPREATYNGVSLDIKNRDHLKGLAALRTTHAAAGTKLGADKLAKELQSAHPGFDWSVRRERKDENSLLEEAKLYGSQLSATGKRGEKLISIDGEARVMDPLLARFRSIQSISRASAFSEWIAAFQEGYMKKFASFLKDPERFPTDASDFKKPEKASLQETAMYREALTHFQYYRSQLETSTFGESVWKDALYWMGEHIEKYSENLAGLFKTIGNDYFPPQVLKTLAFTAMIALRPMRQFVLQPAQLLQAAILDPAYMMNPRKFHAELSGLLYGTMFLQHGPNPMLKHLPFEAVSTLGAKMMGVSKQEYVKFVQSFKDSGLPYSIDTNLLIAGMFNQGNRALVESGMEAAAKNVSSMVSAVPKMGKAAGFDIGETVNMVGSYLFARQRHMRLHPEVPWDSKAGLENIATDARQLSGEMTRGGELAWQRGALSLPFQFLAMPYKMLLAMTTSKFWSAEEKSRLIAGNLVIFGSAGLGLGSLVNKLREEYGDFGADDLWLALEGGLLDLGAKHVINAMTDDKEDLNTLALSKSFSPLGDNIIPVADVFANLREKPFATALAGPSWSLIDPNKGKIPNAWRDISTIFGKKELDTTEKIKRALLEATEVASGGTDWMKYVLAMETGKVISSSGMDSGLASDRKTAIAKLFGVSTHEESDYFYLSSKSFDEAKEIKDASAYIIARASQDALKYGTDEWATLNSLTSSYMSFVGNNPDMELKLNKQINKMSKDMLKNQGENAYSRIYKSAATKSEEDRAKLSKFLRSGTDPRGKQLAEQLNELTGIEAY